MMSAPGHVVTRRQDFRLVHPTESGLPGARGLRRHLLGFGFPEMLRPFGRLDSKNSKNQQDWKEQFPFHLSASSIWPIRIS
jgi:hypothetical protein